MPRRRRSSNTQRAASALSVRPISTCFASLVTRASGRPASRAACLGEHDRLLKAVQARLEETALDGVKELGDPRLRRIGPLGLRDEVDLPAVQALGDDLGPQPAGGERGDGALGGRVERGILLGRRLAALEQAHVLRICAEDLRAAVHAQVEPAGTVRTC